MKVAVARSNEILSTNPGLVDEGLLEIVGAPRRREQVDPAIWMLSMMADQPLPWFYRHRNKTIRSPQERFFGLYAVRSLARGSLIGLTFMQAGDVLLQHNHVAPSLMCFYTSAYHLVGGFLALQGRVILEQVHGPPRIEVQEQGALGDFGELEDSRGKIVLATRSDEGAWTFRLLQRSHRQRWRQLQEVLTATAEGERPDFMRHFFWEIGTYGTYRPSDDQAAIEEGIQQLSEGRHTAIYGGWGFDDFAYDLGAEDPESVTTAHLQMRTRAYREFAARLLDYSLEGLLTLLSSVHSSHWTQQQSLTRLSIFTPPFEIAEPVLANEPELTLRLRDLYGWLSLRNG